MIFLTIAIALQIIIEMLPISSSGHLTLFQKIGARFFQGNSSGGLEDQSPLSDLIQLPTIIIVAVYFFPRWSYMLMHVDCCWWMILRVIFFVGIADSITALAYLVIRYYQLITIPLWAGFLITGLLLASLSWCPEGTRSWNIRDAIILGCVQGIALLPGISRFASTVVVAQWLGLSARAAFEISWAIEVPLLMAAWGQAFFFKGGMTLMMSLMNIPFFCAIVISSSIAGGCLALSWYAIKTHTLFYAAWYMLIPLMLAFFL